MTLPRARRPLLIFTPVERKRTTAVVEKGNVRLTTYWFSKDFIFHFLTIPSQNGNEDGDDYCFWLAYPYPSNFPALNITS